jgi:PiT family inorganic phosphate transporter
MIASLLLTAIIWNLGTWYFGIPCSSSHTLIGSIFGGRIGLYAVARSSSVALNWAKIYDIGLSLLISPVIGFFTALLLMIILKRVIRNKTLYKEPPKKKPPPFWVRLFLIVTCTSVSFTHGSNDGQKGVGLVMMILIAFVPAYFAMDVKRNPAQLTQNVEQIDSLVANMSSPDPNTLYELNIVKSRLDTIKTSLAGRVSFNEDGHSDNFKVRKDVIAGNQIDQKDAG